MRIVSGTFKGRPIKAPKGEATRPTTDRVRESLFNVIAHADWAPPLEGARVMDLFAGSGALGFEALSRGAEFCLFVETGAAARGAIRDNIETLSLFGKTRLHRRSATDLGPLPTSLGPPFNFVFMDPPYGRALASKTLSGLLAGDWLTKDGLAVVETGSEEVLEASGWQVVDERVYGVAKIRFLTRI